MVVQMVFGNEMLGECFLDGSKTKKLATETGYLGTGLKLTTLYYFLSLTVKKKQVK